MSIYEMLRQKSTLLIDDDQWIRDSVHWFFSEEHCRLDAVETAEEGLALCADKHYDVIISDYKLPGMNGLSFFRQMAEDDCRKLLITAYGSDELRRQARIAGVDAVVFKPLNMQAIEDCLQCLMEGVCTNDHGKPRSADLLWIVP